MPGLPGFPFEPDEYARIVYSLILLCVDVSEDAATDWTDATYGLTEEDFIYLEDEADCPDLIDETHGLAEDDFIYLDP